LRAGLKRRGLRFGTNLLPPETNQLINSRHEQKTPLYAPDSGADNTNTLEREAKHTKEKKKGQYPGAEFLPIMRYFCFFHTGSLRESRPDAPGRRKRRRSGTEHYGLGSKSMVMV
jgi:hypothetical protein